MCRIRPGAALAFALIVLGAAAEARAQTLVSGGNAADRTAHNQSLHQGDTLQAENVFYSCAGGDLTTSPLQLTIPASGAGGLNVTYDTLSHGTPTATWDPLSTQASLLAGGTNFNAGNPTKILEIPITGAFGGAEFRFFIGNLWITGSGGPSSGNFMRSGVITPVDVSTTTVVDYATGSMQSIIINPGTTAPAGNITINETANGGHEGIWANSGANSDDFGLRLQIPSGLGVTWDTSILTINTNGNNHVSATVSYPDSLTVKVTVTTKFATSESVTISGLQFVINPTATDNQFRLNVLEGQKANTFVHFTVIPVDALLNPSFIFIKGVPKLDSTQNRIFTVGDPSTAAGDITITDSQGTSKIPSGTTLSLIIPSNPAALNLEWDSGAALTFTTPMTIGPVNYVADGQGRLKTMTIQVTTNTSPGNAIVMHGAAFTKFADRTPVGVAVQLQYDVARPLVNDSKTNVIGKPTIASQSDQVFVVGQGATTLALITIQDDATNPRIKNGVPFVIQMPAGLDITFSGTNPVLSGNLNGTVSLLNPKQIQFTPTVDFAAGATGTITGIPITVASTISIGNLALFMSTAAGATACSTDPKILVIGSFPSMSSAATQQFTVNDPSTAANVVTISTDANSAPLFQPGNSLQLVIPDTFLAEWNNAPAAPSLGGAAAANVNGASITYVLNGSGKLKILQLPITNAWNSGDTLTFTGFELMNFSAPCAGAGTSLILRVSVGGSNAATDTNAKSIGQPSITSAGPVQAFGDTDPSTLASKITITDDPVTPRLLLGNEVRIRIPSGFPMSWDNTVVPSPSMTVVGSGTLGTFGSAGLYYYTNPNGDQVLKIPITANFAPGQAFEIANVRFQNFSVHVATNLQLEVNNKQGTANAIDSTHSVVVGTRPKIFTITTLDQDSNGSIDHLIVTMDRPLDTASTSIATGAGFTVPGYPIVSGNLDPTHTQLTFTLLESGLPDTGVPLNLTYDSTVGSILEAVNDLGLNSVVKSVTDTSPPVIVNFTTTDADGNGHLDKMTFTFSENLTGTPDISQWTIIDADGTTNLLAGLTNSSIQISPLDPTQLIITFSNTIGTAGTPRFQFLNTGIPTALKDAAGNFVATTTNNHPPVAVAGQPRTLFPTVVTLDGSTSHDPDNQPLTFTWSFVGFVPAPGVVPPPPTVTLVNSTSSVCTTLLNTAGVYTFKLVVSDGLASSSATVAITILNVPPTAHAGVNQGSGLAFVLDGRLSTDSNGIDDIQSYSWTLINAPPGAAPMSGVIQNPSSILGVVYFINVAGAHEFELTVTDRAGNVSKDRCFAQAAPTVTPVAVAGPNQVVKLGTQVKLDASSSTTAGGPLTYLWTSTNISSDPVGPLDAGTNTAKIATFTPNGPGVYTFSLVVSDGVIPSNPDTISVLAYDPSNMPPSAVANLLSPVGVPVVGDSVLLDATGSIDPEGVPLKYAWVQTRGPAVNLSSATIARPTFIAPVTGFYEFQLTVNDGVQSSLPVRTSFNVVANAVSAVPAGSIAAPASVSTGTTVVMIPTFSVGTTLFQWTQTAGPLVDLSVWNIGWGPSNAPSQFFAAAPGVYKFVLTAWDGNEVQTGLPVTVVVNGGTPVPTAKAKASPQVVQVGQTITLDATSSLTPPLRYVWSQVAGAPAALSDASAAQPTFVPPAAGVYVFSLKVNDGTSDSAADLVVVTADAAPAAATGGGGGGGGGCGLGVEQLLILPGLWMAAWYRRRRRA